jgi:hypothetical protein
MQIQQSKQPKTAHVSKTRKVNNLHRIDVLLKLDTNGKLTTWLYDKRDDFNFSIVDFPYLCSNIPASPTYGVYISQLIRYARVCSAYYQFLVRGSILTKKLMSQGFQMSRLQAAFRKFYGRYNDLVLFTHTTFLWATCCLMCFITIVKLFFTLIFTTVHTVYLIWKKGSRWVWSIDRGCLLLHGTWSNLWYIQRSVYARSLICISHRTYDIEYCSLFLSFHSDFTQNDDQQ